MAPVIAGITEYQDHSGAVFPQPLQTVTYDRGTHTSPLPLRGDRQWCEQDCFDIAARYTASREGAVPGDLRVSCRNQRKYIFGVRQQFLDERNQVLVRKRLRIQRLDRCSVFAGTYADFDCD